MSQRIYQVMKFFALLVFSFEMLAPAFVPTVSHQKETATRIINATSSTQSQLYCLIAEEFGLNEEDGEGHKEFVPLIDFDLAALFNLHSVESPAASRTNVEHTSDSASPQPLFLLHSIFLI